MEREMFNEVIEAPRIKTLFALTLLVALILLLSKLFNFEHAAFVSIKEYADLLYRLAQEYQLLAPLLFLLVFVTCTTFFIPVTIVLAVLSGFLFGTFWGTLLVTLGVTIGSLIVVQVIKALYAQRVKQQYPKQIQLFDKEMNRYGGQYILGLHLLPFSPTYLINIAAGALDVPAWTFVWATVLGTLPGTIIYAFAGKSLHKLSTLHGIIGMWVVLAMTVMGLLVLASRLFLPKS